jgi:hypothetical protein
VCSFSSEGYFTQESSIATVSWDIEVFDKCTDILTPEMIGWKSQFFGNSFVLSVDTSSFGIAGNYNIIL